MTYGQLNAKANQLANKIMEIGTPIGSNIAILMDRSLEMVISILAILKSGCAYVPIDSEYPKAIINYIINDSCSYLVLTDAYSDLENINYYNVKNIEEHDINTNNPQLYIPDDALAYVIYTSGSTGSPKGVMIEHRNIINLFSSININFNSSDVWTLFHAISFDFSVWELFGALLTGGKLIIVPQNIRKNFREYRKLLIENNVTILNQTPSAFYSLQAEELKYKNKCLMLKHIVLGGEKLNPIYLKEWKEKYNETRIINMYGVTETTIHATYKEINENDINLNISNIGNALPHLKIHLLNNNLNHVVAGEIGEIFIEGSALARGYINNQTLTSNNFIDCCEISTCKLYRSGDLGRYLPNGNIEYIGRVDNQVKIRGHRIELEGIETHINKLEEIKQSIVIVREVNETDKTLALLYISEKEINKTTILNYLSEKIPLYMMPSLFVRVESFHLTLNGKIDRKKAEEHLKHVTNDPTSIVSELKLNNIQKKAFDIIIANIDVNVLNNGLFNVDFPISGLDSITYIKIIVALEDELSFEFDDEMLKLSSFSNIKLMLEYIESKIS